MRKIAWLLLFFIMVFTSYFCSSSTNSRNSPIPAVETEEKFLIKFCRTFSLHSQDFKEEIKTRTSQKFCYKLYINKLSNQKLFFEFIDENGYIEYKGIFYPGGKLKYINVYDVSKNRMNMEYFYDNKNILNKAVLYDDTGNPFANGTVKFTNDDRIILLEFFQNGANNANLTQIVRRDEKYNDVEIATFSSHGTMLSTHLFFYNKESKLIKYIFYKKLKFILGLKFTKKGEIIRVNDERMLLKEDEI